MRYEHRVPTDTALSEPEMLVAHREMQGYSKTDVIELARDARHVENVGIDDPVVLGVVMPAGEMDTDHWLVMPHPFANGLSSHMLLRGMMVQRSVASGQHPLLMLPNNDFRTLAYVLEATDYERMQTKDLDGRYDFSPLADKQAKAIEQVIGSDATVDIIGYSQAAALAPWLARRLPVRTLISADAPNTQPNRNEKRLKKDFVGKGTEGLRGLNQAVRDADIPVLSELLGVRPSGGTSVRQMTGLLEAAYSSMCIPANKVLHTMMSGGAHEYDLQMAKEQHPNLSLVLSRAERSVIFTEEDYDRYIAAHPDALRILLESYGHEAADNITQFAAFARMACAGAVLPPEM